MLGSILIGLLYILMDTIGLIAVIIIVVTIVLERSMRQSQCYQMILYICILDAVQLFLNFISGFLTIWPPHNKISTKYAGALYEAAWISMILIIFLLAVNRVTVICIRHTYKQWIANTCKILIPISVLIGIAFFAISLTPSVTIYYDPTVYFWHYVRSWQAYLYAITESCLLTPISLLSLIIYIVIMIGMRYMQGRSGIRRNVTSSTERRILIQSIALFSFTTNNVFFDFFSYYLLPNTKWTAFSLNLIRHFCIVMVPILNFIFNLSLRKKALQYTKAAIYRLSGSSPPSITQRALMPTTVPIDAGGITRVNITLY